MQTTLATHVNHICEIVIGYSIGMALWNAFRWGADRLHSRLRRRRPAP